MFHDNSGNNADIDGSQSTTSKITSGVESDYLTEDSTIIVHAIMDNYLKEPSKSPESNASPLFKVPTTSSTGLPVISISKLSAFFKQNDNDEAIKRIANRNNRDLPTPFIFHCGIEPYMYATWSKPL